MLEKKEVKVANIVSCVPHGVFLVNSKEELEVANILFVFNVILFSSIQKEVKVVSILFVFHFVFAW
jgi:hypothetical protein